MNSTLDTKEVTTENREVAMLCAGASTHIHQQPSHKALSKHALWERAPCGVFAA